MVLLLSGASHPYNEQTDTTSSIGGYISSTIVPNGQINSLFDDISCYGKNKGKQDTIGIFLKNDTDQTLQNIILQHIYHHDFGQNPKCVKFEWGAVEAADNEFMQKLRNRWSVPYNVEFFNPEAKREFCNLKILTPGQNGDVIEILGETATLGGNTIFDVLVAIDEAIEQSLDFKAQIVNEDTIYIERIELIFTNDPVSILTPGNASSEPNNFSGGFDNGVLLIEEMQPGDVLGLWIKRTINKDKKISFDSIEQQYNDLFGEDFSEGSMEEHNDNEECHEVIFSWD